MGYQSRPGGRVGWQWAQGGLGTAGLASVLGLMWKQLMPLVSGLRPPVVMAGVLMETWPSQGASRQRLWASWAVLASLVIEQAPPPLQSACKVQHCL